jgi:hypothetical protein
MAAIFPFFGEKVTFSRHFPRISFLFPALPFPGCAGKAGGKQDASETFERADL